jgi:large subunit ribosomal protein L15
MPIHRRLPKFGFNNINRIEYKAVNLSTLQELSAKYSVKEVDADYLRKVGIISKNDNVKILGQGELSVALNVKAHAFSKSAIEAIEKAGGKAEKL